MAQAVSYPSAPAPYRSRGEEGAINAKTATRLAGLQLDLASLVLKRQVDQARLLRATKAYNTIYELESRFASDYGTRLMQLSIATAVLLIDSRDEIFAAMEGIYHNALDGGIENEHAAAPVAPKPPAPKPKAKTPASRKPAGRKKQTKNL